MRRVNFPSKFRFRWLPRFSLSSLLWLFVLVSVLLVWHLDRSKLLKQLAVQNGGRSTSWSIEQLLGPPNTASYGDIATAWASSSQDAGDEILIVEFPRVANATGVDIYETYNPGAVKQIYNVSANGAENIIWEGTDPLGTTVLGGISTIAFTMPTRTRRLKILLDSGAVVGWNEIDAVGLIDDQKKRQWASDAWASSSYGFNRPIPKWFWP